MQLSGAQILIRTLDQLGVKIVFGYPGAAILDIYDALFAQKDIRHVLTSHEQGAVHAADGYSRSSGRVGVCLATSGPGVTNLVTGLATAYMDSVPVVAITGNVPQDLIGRDAFQEVDTTGITMPITKHNYMVKDVAHLSAIVREAFAVAVSGRPGPVLVDIPKDVAQACMAWTLANPRPEPATPSAAPLQEALIKKASCMIKQAQRPLVLCGGGVVFSDSSAVLSRFVEKTDTMAAFTMMGLTALPFDHPRNLGMAGMHGTYAANRALEECDLLIAIGTRFSDRVAGNRSAFAPHAKIIHIDVDNSEHDKNIQCDLAITAHAGEVLQALCWEVDSLRHEEWNARITSHSTGWDWADMPASGRLTMRFVVETLSRLLPRDAIVVTDVGQHQVTVARHYRFYTPHTFLCSCGLGTMGYGLGAAIGAKIAHPERMVVLVTGDGSFHMNMNELACVVSENLPIAVVVLNNAVLGMVRQWQRTFYDRRYAHTDLNRHTDYVKLAEAFGLEGYCVDQADELNAVLSKALNPDRPTLTVCAVDRDETEKACEGV